MTVFLDRNGHRYGKLLVTKTNEKRNGRHWWLCKCDCGNTTWVTSSNLGKKLNGTKSCGCIVGKNSKHGMEGTPEYDAWHSMKQRCLNKNHKAYKNYGGRGVKICKRWVDSFENFYADMGPRPKGDIRYTLERKNNKKGYSKANCEWATYAKQIVNRRNTIWIDYLGERKTLMDWCKHFGVSHLLVRNRLRNGNTYEEAFSKEYLYRPKSVKRKIK